MLEKTAHFMWEGTLTLYEFKSIQSAVKHGFITNVWSYSPLELPDGAILRDASLIMPKEQFTSYKLLGSPNLAVASDIFRLMLLLQEGGWWFDCDCYIVRPVEDFVKLSKLREIVVGNPTPTRNLKDTNNGIMYSNNNDFLQCMLEIAHTKIDNNSNVKEYFACGGRSLVETLIKFKLENTVMGKKYFDPLPYNTPWMLLDIKHRDQLIQATNDSFVVHTYNSRFREFASIFRGSLNKHFNKTMQPPSGSYLEYLIDSI